MPFDVVNGDRLANDLLDAVPVLFQKSVVVLDMKSDNAIETERCRVLLRRNE